MRSIYVRKIPLAQKGIEIVIYFQFYTHGFQGHNSTKWVFVHRVADILI